MNNHFDYLVIGAGSGGIASARRAAEYGAKVAVVEYGPLGGTCVNLGCVPKKVMWNAAGIAETLHQAKGYGFAIGDGFRFDWNALKTTRDAYIKRLNGIYQANLDGSGVTLIRGKAKFLTSHQVRVGETEYSAEHLLIATGGVPEIPDLPGAELGITSDGFFALETPPKKVLVAGAGYIAVELAGVFNALGSDVTLAVRRDSALRKFDNDIRSLLMKQMQTDGIKLETGFVPLRIEKGGNGINVEAETGAKIGGFDCLLWATGRTPNTFALGLAEAGIRLDKRGFVIADEYQNTSQERVYAVGDVTPQIPLTPVAIAAGRRLSDRVFGGMAGRKLDYQNIPTVIFSHPPIGTIGLSEEEAKRQHGEDQVKVYQAKFTDMYFAPLTHKPQTLIKLVTLGPTERVVGCHVLGRGADEMVQAVAIAIKMGATKADFDNTVAIHPTASEELVLMR